MSELRITNNVVTNAPFNRGYTIKSLIVDKLLFCLLTPVRLEFRIKACQCLTLLSTLRN